MAGIGQQLNYLNQASQYAINTAQIGAESSLYQSRSAFEMALLEARGLDAQLQIQQVTTAANVAVDIYSLGTRNMQLLAGKGMEMYTLMAQTREKVHGLFTQITTQRTATAWNNMKQMVSGFKF